MDQHDHDLSGLQSSAQAMLSTYIPHLYLIGELFSHSDTFTSELNPYIPVHTRDFKTNTTILLRTSKNTRHKRPIPKQNVFLGCERYEHCRTIKQKTKRVF